MIRVLLTLGLLTAFGCSPRLGDSCDTSVDCSVQGDRECDLSSPGGYCTISDCIPGDCLDEGYCVRFEPDEGRLSSSWCMAKCKRNKCRDDYRCLTADDLNVERCDVAPKDAEAWRDEYDGDLKRLEEDDQAYKAELEAWVEMGSDPDAFPEPTTAAKLTLLEACINSGARAAEVLDKKTDGKFCVQGVPPLQTDSAQSDPEMSTAP